MSGIPKADGTFSMSGHTRMVNGVPMTAAQMQALQKKQAQQAAIDAENDRVGTDVEPVLSGLRPGKITKSGGSVRSSGSKTYDYTGMDEAAKVAQALQAAEGSFVGVALEDPMKIPQLQNSIRSMQQYLTAYQNGQGLPPVRVKSENSSTGSSAPGGSTSFTRDALGQRTTFKNKKDTADAGGGAGVNMVMPVQGPEGAPQDVRPQAARGPDNVDVDVDPRQKPNDMLRRQNMPGLQHQSGLLASLLTQYV